jgi:hypothetical protein
MPILASKTPHTCHANLFLGLAWTAFYIFEHKSTITIIRVNQQHLTKEKEKKTFPHVEVAITTRSYIVFWLAMLLVGNDTDGKCISW